MILDKIARGLSKQEPYFIKTFDEINKLENKDILFPVCLIYLDTSENYYLVVNPNLLGEYSVRDQLTLIIHELLHYINQHHKRRFDRNGSLWNLACDCAVNSLLIDRLTVKLKKTLILPEIWNLPLNESAEWYYQKLEKLEVDFKIPVDGGWGRRKKKC